jgi:hypothetical protein
LLEYLYLTLDPVCSIRKRSQPLRTVFFTDR